jgi:hypothetical protein
VASVLCQSVRATYPNAAQQRVMPLSGEDVVRVRPVDWCNNEWSLRFSFVKTYTVCFAAWPGDSTASGSCARISSGPGATTRMGDTSQIEAGKRTRRRFGVPLGPDCRYLTKVRAKPPGCVAGRYAAAASGHADRAITVQPHTYLPAHGRSNRQSAAGAVGPAPWMKAPRIEPGRNRTRCRRTRGKLYATVQ